MKDAEQQVVQKFQKALELLRDPENPSPRGIATALLELKKYLKNTDDFEANDAVIIFSAQVMNEFKRFLDSNELTYPQYNTQGRREKLTDFIAGLNALARQIKDSRTNERAFFRMLSDVRDEVSDVVVLIGKILILSLHYGAVFSMVLVRSKD